MSRLQEEIRIQEGERMIEEIKPEETKTVVENPPKYRAEVAGIGENKWSGNALEYDTEEEAKKYLDNLSMRWFGYDLGRVVPVSVPRNQPVDMEHDTIYQNFRSSRNPAGGYLLMSSVEKDEDGSPLYWSNDDGWVDMQSATEFTEKEAKEMFTPWMEATFIKRADPLPNRHYTPEQRKAIMKTPQFLEWKQARKQTLGSSEPEQGWFHAFMTDVGKDADRKGVGRFPGTTRRSDMKGVDVTPKRKYYHRLPRKVRKNPPLCPHCQNIVLEPIKTNPPGAMQCPKCKKVYMENPKKGVKDQIVDAYIDSIPPGLIHKISKKSVQKFREDLDKILGEGNPYPHNLWNKIESEGLRPTDEGWFIQWKNTKDPNITIEIIRYYDDDEEKWGDYEIWEQIKDGDSWNGDHLDSAKTKVEAVKIAEKYLRKWKP